MPDGTSSPRRPGDDASATAGVAVLRRQLGAREIGAGGVTRLLDAVIDDAGRLRAFFGNGTLPAAFHPDGAPGCARPEELREVSGGTMLVARGDTAPLRLALSTGDTLALTPVA
ncbi:MAG TPA: hypothetical protein VGA75_14110, partial [Paracoccaceae bacterium]